MPTNSKRQARGRVSSAGITKSDYIYFSSGDFFEAENYAEGKTEEELKAFWNKHRHAIIERYLEEERLRGHKGSRPWAFWQWDQTEPRLPLETDYAYLKRLGLLESWEIEKSE